MKKLTLRGTLIEIYKKVKDYYSNSSNNLTEKRKLEILILSKEVYYFAFVRYSQDQFGFCVCFLMLHRLKLINKNELNFMGKYILSEIDNLDEYHCHRLKVKNKGDGINYRFNSNEDRYFFLKHLIKKLTNGNN